MPKADDALPLIILAVASTAAGVAVGSTVGHGLSSMLFGGGGGQQVAPAAEPQQQSFEERRMGGSCEIQAKGTSSLSGSNLVVLEPRTPASFAASLTFGVEVEEGDAGGRAKGITDRRADVRHSSRTDFTSCLSATGSDMSACNVRLSSRHSSRSWLVR